MKEYIEREAAIKTIDNYAKTVTSDCKAVVNAIRDIVSFICPTADVQEVRYGEWIPDDYEYNHCSECGYEHDTPEYVTPYCPNCGAKMDKE